MAHNGRVESDWLEKVVESLKGIEYGNVQLTFHDGRLVQIDRTVRSRFPAVAKHKLWENNKTAPARLRSL